MQEVMVLFVVGVICIVIGISNMRGNISSLHSYHRKRVAEEDILPFGKKVGSGMIICGGGLVINSILTLVSTFTQKQIYMTIGMIIMIVGFVFWLSISLWAIIKYNKGLF